MNKTLVIYKLFVHVPLYALRLAWLMILSLTTTMLYAEEDTDTIPYQYTEISTNLIYLSTTSPNMGIEVGLTPHFSASLLIGYNPIKFAQRHDDQGKEINPKLMHWAFVPEIKYWVNPVTRHNHWGIHGIYSNYNVGGISLGTNSLVTMPFAYSPLLSGVGNFLASLKDYRYDGWCAGGGISWGYKFYYGERTRLDLSVGVGYIYFEYNKYKACRCSNTVDFETFQYIGPTQLSVTLSYILK